MEIDLINRVYREGVEVFKDSVLKRHWDMLIMVTEGAFSARLQGRQKPFTVEKGGILLIPTDTELTRQVISPVSYYFLSFYPQADHPFYQAASGGVMALSREHTEPIFRDMKQAFVQPDARELICHMIEHVFAKNYLFGKAKNAPRRQISPEITNTIVYMNKNLQERLDMDELAARVYLSHSGLIWKFKKELGTTPVQYLYLLRMRYAKQLLLNHPYSIGQISEMCGYSNPFYFTNLFREYSGMSPSAFRKHHLKKSE